MDNNHSNKSSSEQLGKKRKSQSSASFSPVFHFNDFKVGNLENASAINFGNNYPTNFKGYKRHSQGLGTIEGNQNDIHDLESSMNQKYLLDAIVENQEELPDWIKEMVHNQPQEYLDDEEDDEEDPIYHQIIKTLYVEEVPLFFKELNKKRILKKVWGNIQQLCHSIDFQLFYYRVLRHLNEIPFINLGISSPKLDYQICKKFADSIEEKSKSLILIIYLIEIMLPGYLLKHQQTKLKVSTHIFSSENNEQLHTKEIIEIIYEGYHISPFPPFRLLNDYPEVVDYIYYYMIKQISLSNYDLQFFHKMKALFMTEAANVPSHFLLDKLSVEEQSFLITTLMNNLDNYPKYLFLEYVTLPLCESN